MAEELLPPNHLPYLDSHSDLDHLGPVGLDHPAGSVIDDREVDIETIHEDDELIIATDLHHNGMADHLKAIDPDGEYSAWEYRRDAEGSQWIRTDHGRLDGRIDGP